MTIELLHVTKICHICKKLDVTDNFFFFSICNLCRERSNFVEVEDRKLLSICMYIRLNTKQIRKTSRYSKRECYTKLRWSKLAPPTKMAVAPRLQIYYRVTITFTGINLVRELYYSLNFGGLPGMFYLYFWYWILNEFLRTNKNSTSMKICRVC